MPKKEINLEPVTHITVDAIGKPGERTFYLQGIKGSQTVHLLIEKVQLQTLVAGAEQFLQEIAERYPQLKIPEGSYSEDEMRISPPVEPEFRVGDIGLAFDLERDLVCIISKEISLDLKEEKEMSIARFWCTRSQLSAIAKWGNAVAARGRPICPQCLQPMEAEGHFCPKKNGRKR